MFSYEATFVPVGGPRGGGAPPLTPESGVRQGKAPRMRLGVPPSTNRKRETSAWTVHQHRRSMAERRIARRGPSSGLSRNSLTFLFLIRGGLVVDQGRSDSRSSSGSSRAPSRNLRTRRKNEADPRVGRWLISYYFFFFFFSLILTLSCILHLICSVIITVVFNVYVCFV